MTNNPYISATSADDGPNTARTQILVPAIALLVLAALTLLLELLVGFTIVVDTVRFVEHFGLVDGLLRASPFMLGFLAVFASHLLVLIGARKMLVCSGYRLAVTAALLSMVPIVSPAYLLGIPFGVWAFVTLRKPDVRDAFDTIAT